MSDHTQVIDKLYCELAYVTQAYNNREIEMIKLLLEVEANGYPHGSNQANPDGCECHECELHKSIKKYIANLPKWIIDFCCKD